VIRRFLSSAIVALVCAQAMLAAQAPAPGAVQKLPLTAGRSTVLTLDFDVTRISVTNPAVADAVVVQPREILIDGKSSGTVSLIVWGAARRQQYDLIVEPPVSPLQQQLQSLFPGEDIRVSNTSDAVVLSGNVSSNTVMLRAGEIATATSDKSRVINLLQLPGGMESQQVLLQVRFAEVNRRALTAFGSNFFTGATGYKDYIARTTTGQQPAPTYENLQRTEANGATTLSGDLTFSDFLNLFVLNTKYNAGAVIQALKTSGHFQSLAEPNLIAYNGQEASFLAGGEFPVPVVQGTTGAVMVQFREFGVRLSFRPTIAGNVIRLHVKPEVSSLDFSNGVTLQGFRIPALLSRKAETEVELRDGQSFAIAGLMDNTAQDDRQKIPVLGDLPIIGQLFKSFATRKEQTELLVLITPRLVRPLDPDEVPELPTTQDRFLPPPSSPTAGTPGIVDAPEAGSPR
jgi:pilus assembly protein CpaC